MTDSEPTNDTDTDTDSKTNNNMELTFGEDSVDFMIAALGLSTDDNGFVEHHYNNFVSRRPSHRGRTGPPLRVILVETFDGNESHVRPRSLASLLQSESASQTRF